MVSAIKRMGCIAICVDCVRKGEDVLDKQYYGDFGLCDRCHKSVTGLDIAHYVRPEET